MSEVVLLELPEGFDYECEACEVGGYGETCWYCGSDETIGKISRIALKNTLHPGVLTEDLMDANFH